MIVGHFVSAVGFGVIFARMRSLFPAIIAHMIFDIPMTPMWQGLLVIALVMCSVFIWEEGDIGREMLSTGERATYWILALVGIACAVAGTRFRGMEYVGLGMVVLAVAFESLDLRSESTTSEAKTLATRESRRREGSPRHFAIGGSLTKNLLIALIYTMDR